MASYRRYLRFLRDDVEADVDDELRFHFDERIDALTRSGMSPDAARRQAVEEFGDVAIVRAGLHDIDRRIVENQGRAEWWSTFAQEVHRALRRLMRSPAFTIPAVLTLALGIGATTAIFAVVNAVVLSPLPYRDADRLVALASPVPGMSADAEWGLARHQMFYYKENTRALEELGVYQASQTTVLGTGSDADAERVPVVLTSSTLLGALGFRPQLGRLLLPEDNILARERPQVVVLGNGLWQRRFGGDPFIVGKTINIEGYGHEVVGVLPPGADLPDQKVDLWVPAYVDPAAVARSNHTWRAIGRLRAGFTAADLEREVAPLVARFPEIFPTAYSKKFMEGSGFRTRVTALREEVVGDVVTRALWIILGSVALVFLVAAANVANLFLVRVDARRRETAMRTALGAGRSHLAAHFLAEGVVLALVAAGCAMLLAWAGLRTLLVLAPTGIPRLAEVRLGWQGVTLALGVALTVGAALSLIPLLSARIDLTALREGSRTLTLSRRRHAVRAALVVSQVALALVLLAAAGLMLQSFRNLRSVQPGFDPSGVLTMTVSLPAARYATQDATAAYFEQLGARLQSLPGVESVGFGPQVPLAMEDGCTSVITEAPTRAERREACVMVMQVTPGYLETMRIRMDGRAPSWAETNARSGAVVITRALAEQLWPGESAIGKGLRCCNYGQPHYRVVGVTEDVRGLGLDQPPIQTVFFPMLPIEGAPIEGVARYMHVVVRGRDDRLEALAPLVRAQITELDRQVPIANIRTMDAVVARSMAKRSFTLMLLGIASGMALLLSAIGLYGVVSYVVGERRGEIGVRMALGAPAGRVGGMVVLQSVRLAVLGVLLGIGGALAATRLLQSLLFGVEPTDWPTLLIVSAFLVILAAVASYAPARRAMGVDPVEALRG